MRLMASAQPLMDGDQLQSSAFVQGTGLVMPAVLAKRQIVPTGMDISQILR